MEVLQEPSAGAPMKHRRIVVGVCAMEKKTKSRPMRAILSRLEQFGNGKEFSVVLFGDECIQHKPVEEWPKCDCLISFHSSGFPLAKAREYVTKFRPFCVNDIGSQNLLLDRRAVYRTLQRNGILLPRHKIMERDAKGNPLLPFQEAEDYVEIDGVRINKPFVEKPVSGEDHNIYIYYPQSAGGGSKRLFRKTGNLSSRFFPDIDRVRRDAPYIYEEFLPTDGTDVKVYTVGPDYAHAEARKAPTLDGVVERDDYGKEVRFPVILYPHEKEIARRVCLAFQQTVCGFDILRYNGRSFVCDVNGWSFVKNSERYYDDCSQILRECFLAAMIPNGRRDSGISAMERIQGRMVRDLMERTQSHFGRGEQSLRCVIAITRHGDRTPKQKLKLKTKRAEVLELVRRFGDGQGEVLLKTAQELQAMLDAVRAILAHCDGDAALSQEESAKLELTRRVLESGEHFRGINRKVQLKPREGNSSVLVVVKWGGVLTRLGIAQAEAFGKTVRAKCFEDAEKSEDEVLLQLHSSLRHDLKIYSSSEGRVQQTAAAFAKGMLGLEGELQPISASLVRKGGQASKMLDDVSRAAGKLAECRARLRSVMLRSTELTAEEQRAAVPSGAASLLSALSGMGSPRERLEELNTLIQRHVHAVRAVSASTPKGPQPDVVGRNEHVTSTGETIPAMAHRWEKLAKDFYSPDEDEFDISKVPDIYDNVRYDFLHHSELELSGIEEFLETAKLIADYVMPQEYGMSRGEKLTIGRLVCHRLLRKLRADVLAAARPLGELGFATPSQEYCGDEQTPSWAVEAATGTSVEDSFLASCSPENRGFHYERRSSRNSTGSSEDNDYESEVSNRLNLLYVTDPEQINEIRARLYFTCESHMHSLVNVLRYGLTEDGASLLEPEAQRRLASIAELGFLSSIVVRVFETGEEEQRFRWEILFSPGASDGSESSPLEEIARGDDVETLVNVLSTISDDPPNDTESKYQE